jgi:hypothetical protein
MNCDELTLSNDCCENLELDCSTTGRTSCMVRASLLQQYDDSDEFEDSLWVA